jgi:hypothetical protein
MRLQRSWLTIYYWPHIHPDGMLGVDCERFLLGLNNIIA